MDRPSDKTSPQPHVKINSQEMDHIIQARENLDDMTELAQYASLYKNIGWSPVALNVQAVTGQGVDFDQPEATWSNSLLRLASKNTRVSLAIRLEPDSRLFVLKVNPAFGKEFLNSLGDWQSPCIAQAGDSWENHFLVLPQDWGFIAEHPDDSEDAPVSFIGPGSLVPVPPSGDPASRETWHWFSPPWEQPPWHPSPGLLLLLEEVGYISRKNPLPGEDLPSWEELYPVICRAPMLLQAVMTPVAPKELYYRTIMYTAIRAGFRDARMLRGLLWHAPHGVTRQGLEARQQLSQWAMEIQWLLSSEVSGTGSGSPHAAYMPGAGIASPRRGGKPMKKNTFQAEANMRKELNLLASLALELEQQVEELERQQLSSEVEAQSNWQELQELRGALEQLLAKRKDLSESK